MFKAGYQLAAEEMGKSRIKAQRKQREWDLYFLEMVELVRQKSEDPNTKVGCILVAEDNQLVSTGYNGLPRKVKAHKHRLTRENGEKYHWFEHAERNAIYNAVRHGVRLLGCTAYVSMYPCTDCARALIQSGISEIVIDINNLDLDNVRWRERYARSSAMLMEAKVRIRKVNCDA